MSESALERELQAAAELAEAAARVGGTDPTTEQLREAPGQDNEDDGAAVHSE